MPDSKTPPISVVVDADTRATLKALAADTNQKVGEVAGEILAEFCAQPTASRYAEWVKADRPAHFNAIPDPATPEVPTDPDADFGGLTAQQIERLHPNRPAPVDQPDGAPEADQPDGLSWMTPAQRAALQPEIAQSNPTTT